MFHKINFNIYFFLFKGTVPPKKKLYYSFDRDENLHTYVKSKIKWGNCLELFSIFFIENELFTENVKKGGPRRIDRPRSVFCRGRGWPISSRSRLKYLFFIIIMDLREYALID